MLYWICDSPGKNIEVGSHSLLQGIFPTQESNQGLLRQILYQLSYQGSPTWNISSVQLLSHVLLFTTPWSAAHQASLSIANSWSFLKLMSVESVMPSNHLILCHPLLFLPLIFPSIRVFQMSQLFPSGGQSIGVSSSTSVLTMNIQDWFPLGLTGLISLQSYFWANRGIAESFFWICFCS